MSDLSLIPLQDGFETQLSQDWDGNTGTIYVLATPSYTPTTTNTYIVVNPGKTNMQIAEITDYDSTAKTLSVSSISFEKGLGISSTAQSHSTGEKVIISDNYQFWEDIQTAINTKLDDTGGTMTGLLQFSGTTHAGIKLLSLTTTQRDALSASNGMIIYNSTTGELNQYIGGAWSAVSAGSTQPTASTTVLGKIKTDVAPVGDPVAFTTDNPRYAATAGNNTDIAIGANNTFVSQTGLQHNAEKYATDGSGSSTAYTATLSPVPTSLTNGMMVYVKIGSANTTTTPTLNVNSLGAKTIVKLGGTALAVGDIAANMYCTFMYDLGNTRWIMQNPVANVITPASILTYAVNADETVTTWYTYQVPIIALSASTLAGWTNSGQSAMSTTSVTAAGACQIGPNIGAGYISTRIAGSAALDNYQVDQNKAIRIKLWLRLGSTGNYQGFGFHLTGFPTNIYATAASTSDGNIRFVLSGSTFYAENANGTTNTQTDISSGITTTNWNLYEIIFTPGTSALFYVNGTLKATHTTNLPTGAKNLSFGIGSSTAHDIYTNHPIFSIQL